MVVEPNHLQLHPPVFLLAGRTQGNLGPIGVYFRERLPRKRVFRRRGSPSLLLQLNGQQSRATAEVDTGTGSRLAAAPDDRVGPSRRPSPAATGHQGQVANPTQTHSAAVNPGRGPRISSDGVNSSAAKNSDSFQISPDQGHLPSRSFGRLSQPLLLRT